MRALKLFWILVAVCLMACTPDNSALNSKIPQEPKVKAVLIYADWCASCKVLEPKINKVRAKFESQGLVFSQLDFTKKNEGALFAQSASQNIEAAMRLHLVSPIKTGQLILVPMSGDAVLDVIYMNHTLDDIERKFTTALSRQTQ